MNLGGTMDGMKTIGRKLITGLMKNGINTGEMHNMYNMTNFLPKNLLQKILNYKMP